jgi:glycosyltransferase involved in cell wall biosynthesis
MKPMRVLHVSWTDTPGERFNGFDMMQRAPQGVEMRMAVISKSSGHPSVSCIGSSPGRPGARLLRRLDRVLGLDGLLGTAGSDLASSEAFGWADVVHLHLIHIGPFFSIRSLPALSGRRPLVWTAHDSWACTGMCVHPFECGAWRTGCRRSCPHPRGGSPFRRLTPRLLWERKRRALSGLDVDMVAASAWMERRLAGSPLTQALRRTVIPFGIDPGVFRPGAASGFREACGIGPEDLVLVLRGVDPAKDSFKGMAFLHSALETLEAPPGTVLLVAGDACGFTDLAGRYRLMPLGWLSSSADFAAALAAADLLLMPSLQESFGLTAVEAMACGTPPVVTEGTALPEVTFCPDAGASSPAGDAGEYASLVARLASDRQRLAARSARCREKALAAYSIGDYVSRHMNLYAAALARRAGGEIAASPGPSDNAAETGGG